MVNKYILKVLSAGLLLASASLQAEINNTIIMSIEEPSAGSVMTGIANLRGWAVAPVKINRIEWFLDGEAKGIIPYGGNREDVGQQHSQLPNSGLSGYASALNYSLLPDGAHTLRVRAVDVNGDHNELIISFNVTRFNSSFIKGENGVSIANADISKQGETILLNNVEADGKAYNIVLKWNSATQRFDPTDITLIADNGDNPTPPVTPQIPDVKGIWSIQAALSEGNCSILPRADADYNLTTQNNADFSGTVSSNGRTEPVSGQVETNGQFKSSTAVTVQGCTVSSEIEGNFLTNAYKTTISGLSPVTAPACILAGACLGSVYTGTITRK